MNKVYLQLWEQSNRFSDNLSDGCTLHLNENEHQSFILNIRNHRDSLIPDIYDRPIGQAIEVFISDTLFTRLQQENNLKIQQNELNNLLSFEEIILKNDWYFILNIYTVVHLDEFVSDGSYSTSSK